MTDTTFNLIVSLDTEQEIPEQMLYRLTGQMLRDISKLGVDSVKRAESSETKMLVKGGFPIDVNTLVISLGSAGVLTAIIHLMKDWALRAEGRKVKVRAEIRDRSIEFEYSPTATSEEELMDFADRLIWILKKSDIESP
jgi:hypothetical protein